MCTGRGISDQTVSGGQSRLAHSRAQSGSACNQHADKIGHGRTGYKQPAGRIWKSEQLTHPTQQLAFNFDRDLLASAKIGVETCREHFCQHPDRRTTAMNPTHETRMRIANRIRQHILHKGRMRRHKIARLHRHRQLKHGTHLSRDRLPDRAISHIFNIVEHIVQHLMALMPELLPVFRIKRFLRCFQHVFSP